MHNALHTLQLKAAHLHTAMPVKISAHCTAPKCEHSVGVQGQWAGVSNNGELQCIVILHNREH